VQPLVTNGRCMHMETCIMLMSHMAGLHLAQWQWAEFKLVWQCV